MPTYRSALGCSFVRDRRAPAGGRRHDAVSTQKTIFITGTSSGLGRASVKLFSTKGWRVIATMRGSDAHEKTELSELRDVTVLPLDVTDSAQINDTVAKAVAMSGVDVVFNNAGYGRPDRSRGSRTSR